MNLCKYKDSLGKLNTGIHATRDPIFGTALWDVFMTIVGSIIIAQYLNYSLFIILIILFSLGIFLHRIFCVRTTIDKLLFY
jgi:hypothetical protein